MNNRSFHIQFTHHCDSVNSSHIPPEISDLRLKIPSFLVSPHHAAAPKPGSFQLSSSTHTFSKSIIPFDMQGTDLHAGLNMIMLQRSMAAKHIFVLFSIPLLVLPKMLQLFFWLPLHTEPANTVSENARITFLSCNHHLQAQHHVSMVQTVSLKYSYLLFVYDEVHMPLVAHLLSFGVSHYRLSI